MAPQYPSSEAMERPGPHPLGGHPQQVGDPVSKLARRLVRESNGQDSVRWDTSLMNEVGNPGGEDPRLSRPGPRQDEQRTLEVVHRFSLFGVQLLQVSFG